MSAAIVRVYFRGDAVECVRDDDGTVWVSVRRVCESLGIDHARQLQKLKTKPWATVDMKPTVAEDGKTREMAALHIDALPMWLATIDESRVATSVRPKLAAYQTECAKALRDYFFGGAALNPNATREQKAGAEEAWRRWISDGIEDHEALWVGRVVEELARLWKQPAKVAQAGGFPVGLIAAVKHCYASVVGGDFYQALRDKTGFGEDREKRYRGLTREGYDKLSRELICIERIARTCRSKEEFVDKMNYVYAGQPMQTGFW